MTGRLRAAVACVAALAVMGGASGAVAAPDMQTGIADDAQILYSGPAAAARAVAQWQQAGIDVVRVHARWAFIAPGVHDTRRPAGFHPRDPADVHYNWGLLDHAVDLLRAAGIEPMLAITGSGPVWGTRYPRLRNPRWEPDPKAFGDFAHAVAARYADRVSQYVIWNEPNQPGWLQPQFRCHHGRCTPRSPDIYRELFRSAAREIRSAEPGAKVLIGALAPRGHAPTSRNAVMHPLQFIRRLGCVNASYHRLTAGTCARARAVRSEGFAYHPHPVHLSPTEHSPNPEDAAIADLPRLEKVLDRTAAHGLLKPLGTPRFDIYLTEFGYQTRPPDPISGVTPAQQALWEQHAAYIAYRDARVRNLTQYLWRDEPLKREAGRATYGSWQSGVYFANGHRKPLRHAFPNPFYADRLHSGVTIFWGQVRPGSSWTVTLQRHRAGTWEDVFTMPTDERGFWLRRRASAPPGRYRFQYVLPDTDPAVVVSSAVQTLR